MRRTGSRRWRNPGCEIADRSDIPGHDLQLVVNGAAHGGNRKVSNLINMGQVARHPLIVLADSDIAVDPNYLRTLAVALAQPGAGAVTCLYRGAPNGGFWSRLSVMAVDDHFLPSAILGLALGLARPCLGATIALSRETLSRIGGFEAVANQLADDYAIGKAVRQAGLRIVLPPLLVAHSFQEKSLSEVVQHELRWARTIFTVDPVGYIGSGFTHALPLSLMGGGPSRVRRPGAGGGARRLGVPPVLEISPHAGI